MSRFFFDSFDGEKRFEDREGVEFRGNAAAEDAAVYALVSIARDTFSSPTNRAIEMIVRDSDRKPIMACTLSLAVRRPD
jgi:hypothetical protein